MPANSGNSSLRLVVDNDDVAQKRNVAMSAPITYSSPGSDFFVYQAPPPIRNSALSEDRSLRKASIIMAASDDLTDAKIGKASAETETKIARLEGKIDMTTATIIGKLDSLKDDLQKNDSYNRDTRLLTLATIVAAAIALGGLMVAMATYGDALFGRGMNVRDVVQSTIKETVEQIKNNDANKSLTK